MSKCSSSFFVQSTTSLLAAEPGAQPALCLRGVLGDLPVEPVDGRVEVFAGLAGELLASSAGLIPLLLRLDAQLVVLGLSLSTVLLGLVLGLGGVCLGLVLCLLGVGPEIGFGLLCLGAGAVGLVRVSGC